MATRKVTESDMRRISELTGVKIESGDPDPRGWTVCGPDGSSIGRVNDLLVDMDAMKVRHLLVEPDASAGIGSDEYLTFGVDEVDLRPERQEVVARAFERTSYEAARNIEHDYEHRGRAEADDRATLTRSEEELHIGKREVVRGEARIGKHVEHERVSEPVTTRREELVIERRPVAGGRADATIGEDEVRIPLKEEEVVVEKRPVVKEEVVVGKRVVEERQNVEADVRREKLDIDQPVGAREDNPRRDR